MGRPMPNTVSSLPSKPSTSNPTGKPVDVRPIGRLSPASPGQEPGTTFREYSSVAGTILPSGSCTISCPMGLAGTIVVGKRPQAAAETPGTSRQVTNLSFVSSRFYRAVSM